jgi:hypothetical protein
MNPWSGAAIRDLHSPQNERLHRWMKAPQKGFVRTWKHCGLRTIAEAMKSPLSAQSIWR